MRTALLLLFALCLVTTSTANALEINLTNAGKVVMDEVAIGLIPLNPTNKLTADNKTPPKEVVQKDYQFQPRITVVQKHDTVAFPNKDSSHHNVYSFSEAKRFDFRLFQGKGESTTLDKTGVITVGCNIHDWMLSYIVVFDTPYYALGNKQGTAIIENIPAGEYEIMVWHPGLSPEAGPVKQGKITLTEAQTTIPAISIPQGDEHDWPETPDEIEEDY